MSFHNHTAEHSAQRSDRKGFLTSPAGLVMIGFLAIAGVYLWMEHHAHLLGVVVWLPLLACPLSCTYSCITAMAGMRNTVRILVMENGND